MSDPVRVLLVDDSAIHRRALAGYIRESEGLELCGQAKDGAEAVELVRRLRPSVILMDVQMPLMDGLQATEAIMAERPTPIMLMTAADNFAREVDLGLRALALGALDLIPKPDLEQLGAPRQQLASRLQLLAGVPVIHHPRGRAGIERKRLAAESDRSRAHTSGYFRRARRVIGIVSSTGGPRALTEILSHLPADLPAAVVIVQHIDAGFEEGLARWLNENSPLSISMGVHDTPLLEGRAYLGPTGRHVEVTGQRRLGLVKPEVYRPGRHYPSGDHLLTSLASAYGASAVGVVLTGIGSDGALGLRDIHDAGGKTVAQDEATSVVYGMPGVAAQLGAAQRILPLQSIAEALRALVR